jgi:hypothetical protein
MDLKNNRITMGELLNDPRSRAVLQRYFPRFVNNPLMVRMGRGMTLQQTLQMARNHGISQAALSKAMEELRNI